LTAQIPKRGDTSLWDIVFHWKEHRDCPPAQNPPLKRLSLLNGGVCLRHGQLLPSGAPAQPGCEVTLLLRTLTVPCVLFLSLLP
jgi:hypothetical protein